MGKITRLHLISFDDLLEQGEVLLNQDMDFGSICELLSIDSGAMDRYLRETTGYSGEYIVDSYRERLKN